MSTALLAQVSTPAPAPVSHAVNVGGPTVFDVMLHSSLSAILFGVIGIVLLLVGFKLFDWITPKIDVQHELAEKGNVAVAIVVGAILIGLSIILTRVVGG